MIVYNDSTYAFVFEMKDDNFPMILMKNADLFSIKRILNVTETKIGDEYEFYRRVHNNLK